MQACCKYVKVHKQGRVVLTFVSDSNMGNPICI